MEKIKGGYYIKPRYIQESRIAHKPPYMREIWDWIIMQCNHESNKICNRGQCIRTYEDIQKGLGWSIGWRKMKYNKWQCENIMKWLRKATLITTEKTTRGLKITVLNYDYYQDASNYESHKRATREPQSSHTINKNDKEVKELKNKEVKTLSAKKTADPLVKEFIDYYFNTFRDKFREKPVIDGGKDGIIIKRLLSSYSLDRLKELLAKFFVSDDPFIKRTGYTIGVFKTLINKIITGGDKDVRKVQTKNGKLVSASEQKWHSTKKPLV